MTLATTMHLLWGCALKLRQYWLLSLQCGSRLPVDCWIPDDGSGDGGYFRGGILANFCLLFRGHKGDCLGPMNMSGQRVPGGFRYPYPVTELD